MDIELTTEITASTGRVWAVMTDVERWPEWAPTVTSIELLAGARRMVYGSLPAIVDDLRTVRNPGAHAERIERETATRWRERLVGVGCQGVLVELARVRARP